MLVPAKRAPDLPFVNSVCGSKGAHLDVFLMKSTQKLYETCVWVMFSVMSWLHSAETVALASNKRCETNGAKDANALEAHVARLQMKRRQVQPPCRSSWFHLTTLLDSVELHKMYFIVGFFLT